MLILLSLAKRFGADPCSAKLNNILEAAYMQLLKAESAAVIATAFITSAAW